MFQKSRKWRLQKVGRPPAITPTVLQKLEDAFSNALTDQEACIYAGIAPSTLYNYQARYPEFVERKSLLRLTPNIAARKTIIAALGDVKVAQWWAEHRMEEFKPETRLSVKAQVNHRHVVLTPQIMAAAREYEAIRERQIAEESRRLP